MNISCTSSITQIISIRVKFAQTAHGRQKLGAHCRNKREQQERVAYISEATGQFVEFGFVEADEAERQGWVDAIEGHMKQERAVVGRIIRMLVVQVDLYKYLLYYYHRRSKHRGEHGNASFRRFNFDILR